MKTGYYVVRHKEIGTTMAREYLDTNHQWVDNIEKAHTFISEADASKASVDHKASGYIHRSGTGMQDG